MNVVGALAGLATPAGLELGVSGAASEQSKRAPEAALQELMDGNKRYTEGRLTAPAHQLEMPRDKALEKQEPFAGVLAWADRRAPEELVFVQSIGHVFVTREAGNIVTPEIIASLGYGAVTVGTKVMLVMGDSSCAAVKATIQAREVPARSERSTRTSCQQWIKLGQIPKWTSKPTRKFRRGCCGNLPP
jgi:carbonic anhydrase